MKNYTLVAVFSPDKKNILFCVRSKEPFKGLFNLVGGKIDLFETTSEGAYRELEEETGITKDDITLNQVMEFYYNTTDIGLFVFYGILKHEVELKPTENELLWFMAGTNFFNDHFAGEGNIGHIVKQIELIEERKNADTGKI